MPGPFPSLTLFIGPQSSHGLALNLVVRDNRPGMVKAGLAAMPTRLASPALRSIADPNRTLDERRATFAGFSDEAPAFFAALNFLGAPHKGFRQAELYPDAEVQLGLLAEVAGEARFRVVLSLDDLPNLFLATGSDVLEDRVRATPWEQLYAVSWAELVAGVLDCLPGAEVLVLTHAGVALGGATLVARLFGPAAGVLNGRDLLQAGLNLTGQAVLDRMGAATPDAAAARELYRSFADRADAAVCRERLGMDRLTRKLMLQRFDEDMGAIAAMDRVEVI
ncbi:MAG: hypothetical protein KJO42_07100 [Silicimonas sp.]|nr:hypothetical protein [Silicimonas sp.]NND43668.1 hypothetical protein [Silicimonas sp.]